MDKCNEAREAGNKAFEDQQYPEAVKHYQEALKRGPPDVNTEAYKVGIQGRDTRAAIFSRPYHLSYLVPVRVWTVRCVGVRA